jgi:hypothetical protein
MNSVIESVEKFKSKYQSNEKSFVVKEKEEKEDISSSLGMSFGKTFVKNNTFGLK